MAVKTLGLMWVCSLLLWEVSGHDAGDVMTTTDYTIVNEALEEVLHADGEVDVGRRCAIGTANLGSSSLTNPRWYTYSGRIFDPTPVDVPAGQTGLSLFHKKSYATYGTAGVLSYDISGTDYKLVIMWEVPWNSLMYNTKFNVKVYHKNIKTDKDMYNQMMDLAGAKTPSDGWLEREEYGIKVRGTITDDDLARFYVSVNADGFNRFQPPYLHRECDFKASWFGSYCWQECSPNGYCWVNQKCSKDSDCEGQLQCYDPCKKKT